MQKVARGDEKAIRSVINLISERLPPMQIKGFELEVVPGPYDGLSSEEAEARALVHLEKWWDRRTRPSPLSEPASPAARRQSPAGLSPAPTRRVPVCWKDRR